MIRLTAYVSGRVQRAGYRAKVVSMAKDMGLVGLVQNRPDGQVLVIAEGEQKDLEKFASALRIKNAIINVENISAEYSRGSGQYSSFKKITGPDEIGERLDDGIEILKDLVVGLNNLTVITKNGFESLNGKMDQTLDRQDSALGKMDQMLDKQDQALGKMDQMLDKQGATIGEIRGLRIDLKDYMDMRFERIEADLAELKEMKTALKEKGLI